MIISVSDQRPTSRSNGWATNPNLKAPVDLSKPDEFETVSASASVMPPPPADDELSPPAESTEGPEGPFAGAAVAASQNVEVAGPEGQSPVAPETTNLSASSAEFSEFLLAEQRRQRNTLPHFPLIQSRIPSLSQKTLHESDSVPVHVP